MKELLAYINEYLTDNPERLDFLIAAICDTLEISEEEFKEEIEDNRK
jgi:hypothetical protein